MKEINKPTVHSTEDAKLDKAIDQAMEIMNKRFPKYYLYISISLFFFPLSAFWLFFHDTVFHDITFVIMWCACAVGGIGILIYVIVLLRLVFNINQVD